MNKKIKYVLGLDIGIGSLGWAVVRNDEFTRIENFGVRIFDSGEEKNGKERTSQQRRAFRAGRRLTRRRAHRKSRIKYLLQQCGLVTIQEIDAYFSGREKDIISTRVRALDERISPVEIAACLIHLSNNRGLQEFYDIPDDEMDDESKAERDSLDSIKSLLRKGNYRTVAEMIEKDSTFDSANSHFRRYRNRVGNEKIFIMPNQAIREEARLILEKQRQFYPVLSDAVVNKIMEILFSRRDFEDGPGNVNDQKRKYSGFVGTEGTCRFYHDEKRGYRHTYLSDIYALVNILSQYSYVEKETGVVGLPPQLAEELLQAAKMQGTLKVNDVKNIAKRFSINVIVKSSSDSEPITAAAKFLSAVKACCEKNGREWRQFITDNMFDLEKCRLNRIGTILSRCITPSRRRKQLKELDFLDREKDAAFIDDLTRIRLSGTSNVSYKYMTGAVQAFLEGELYGVYQNKINSAQTKNTVDAALLQYKLKPFDKTFDFYTNPVVMRSLSEARKTINRIIEEYGSPYAINIEIGSELSKSYQARQEIEKRQRDNEKKHKAYEQAIATLLNKDVSEVTGAMLERYELGEEQNWQCLYSGEPIDKKAAVVNTGKIFEVDHIVPFSLILDNTLQNKALVYARENQNKKQRVPLEYLNGEAEKNYRARVNKLFRDKKISAVKYAYLMAKSVYDNDQISAWKSRNLNDTRYISKTLLNYLKKYLLFRPADQGDENRPTVYGVKGTITSRMRKLWLNKYTWGEPDKRKLKEVTYLDHAADAIVVACCLPKFVELATVAYRLRQILNENGGKPNAEYEYTLKEAKKYLGRFYNFSDAQLEYYLRINLSGKGNIPSLIKGLRYEVDARLQDEDILNYFEKQHAERDKKYSMVSYSSSAAESKFRCDVLAFYKDDQEFAKSLKMPFTVHIASRKAAGKITSENAVRMAGGKKLKRKLVSEITKDDIPNLYTCDGDLKNSLVALFDIAEKEKPVAAALSSKSDNGSAQKSAAAKAEGTTVAEILAAREKKEFITKNGTYIRRVTLMQNNAYDEGGVLKKQISSDNYSLLPDSSYYCVEVYEDNEGKTRVAGIKYSYLTNKNGRLMLNELYSRPSDYKRHCMYLFTNDYIRITKKTSKKEEVKFEGYYKSVANINQGLFCWYERNKPDGKKKVVGISQKDTLEKYDIDPIGVVGGKIKCGEPLSSIKERK